MARMERIAEKVRFHTAEINYKTNCNAEIGNYSQQFFLGSDGVWKNVEALKRMRSNMSAKEVSYMLKEIENEVVRKALKRHFRTVH